MQTVSLGLGDSLHEITKPIFLGKIRKIIIDLSSAELAQRVKIVCVEVLWPSQPNGVMSRAVNLLKHTFTGQA